jgi:hypothetical protein
MPPARRGAARRARVSNANEPPIPNQRPDRPAQNAYAVQTPGEVRHSP